MNAQTTARRYTCQDCRKTYRSFRSREEWQQSHLADVCAARHGSAPVPAAAPHVPAETSRPSTRAAGRRVATGATRPRGTAHVIAVVAAGIVALMLVAVALDASRTILDAASAGPPPIRLLLAAAVSGPCLYGAYRMGRRALSVLHHGGDPEPVRPPVVTGAR